MSNEFFVLLKDVRNNTESICNSAPVANSDLYALMEKIAFRICQNKTCKFSLFTQPQIYCEISEEVDVVVPGWILNGKKSQKEITFVLSAIPLNNLISNGSTTTSRSSSTEQPMTSVASIQTDDVIDMLINTYVSEPPKENIKLAPAVSFPWKEELYIELKDKLNTNNFGLKPVTLVTSELRKKHD